MILRRKIKRQYKILQNILEAAYDAESSYEQLIDAPENVDFIYLIEHKKEHVSRFILQLILMIDEIGEVSIEKGTVSGGMKRLWNDIFTSVVITDVKYMVDECKSIDNKLLGRINKHVSSKKLNDIHRKVLVDFKSGFRAETQPIIHTQNNSKLIA